MTETCSVRSVFEPAYSSGDWQVNQHEFSMDVKEIGKFYASDGRTVDFYPLPEADPDWVRLYLNGQMLVALLHQRKVITVHASSFVHNDRGILIFGESGAGKSSLTASFALEGSGFLTDDITPVIFRGSQPYIWSLHESIRIRRSTATELKIDDSILREAEDGTGKQYMRAKSAGVNEYPLNTIIKVDVGDVQRPVFDNPLPVDKFSFLRSEICMSELLVGMPETEAAYIHQLLEIVQRVDFVRVIRPAGIKIADLHEAVQEWLEGRAKKTT